MTLKAKALSLTLLLGVLALPALAAARNPGRPGTGPGVGDSALTDGRFLTHYLGLSSSQVTQLQGFLRTLQAAGVAVRTARGPLCQQLRTDITASHPNPTTVGQDFLALVDNEGKVKTALQAFDTSFSAILNGDQLARYDTLKQIVERGAKTPDPLPQCPPASS
jgi:hypothetical protein